MTYKRKLIVYFLIAFCLYVIVDIGIQLNREKRFKTDSLRSNLHAYTEVVENYLASTKDTASVIKLLPENLRVSLINREGVLTYDNAFDISKAENHGNRPEVLAAKLRNSGSATRSSESTKIDYLYYARMLDDGSVIRTSLPYTIKLDDFLHRDSIILYIIILMFVTTLF
ncbi:MAG TPA: two-component sensor histidine kinase, partial [Paludibacteraceae bacterium]|nr:two-component sensor histidine kinase [Paludibacteraceae bacterium]